MKQHVIGVDLGGTKVEACLMDAEQNLISRERVFTFASRGIQHVVSTIINLVKTVAGDVEYSAIGIGTPGTYIAGTDALYGIPHTPVYETPGFIGHLREKLPVPLLIENDANCLALAEYHAQCRGKYSHVLAVIIGTGMGYGLILGDRLYRGARGGAGEIGHTTIDIDGRLCECGRHGCAEAYLSGSSIARRFEELSGMSSDPLDIYQRYIKGDAVAIRVIDESCRIMGEVFANAVNAFDLQAIILGGGVSNLPVWYEKVPEYLNRSLFGPSRDPIPILKAKMGDSAGVLGAAYLALRELGYMDF